MNTLKTIAVAVTATVMSIGAASAATVGTCDTGNSGQLKYVELYAVAANDASNVYCSTDSVATLYSSSGGTPTKSFFGEVYTLADYSDGSQGDGSASLSLGGGSWSISGGAGLDLIVAIKHGQTYAGFKVIGASGTYGTSNNAPSNGNAFSHSALWYRAGTSAEIPLPAAGFLLLGGLGALGIARRRKS